MSDTLANLLSEVSTLKTSLEKKASAKNTKDEEFENFLEKMAMELEEDPSFPPKEEDEEDDGEKKNKDEKEKDESSKEASMNENALVEKVANRVLYVLEKIAVGGVDNAGALMPESGSGSNDPSKIKNLIDAEAAIDQSRPALGEGEVTEPTADLIRGHAQQSYSGENDKPIQDVGKGSNEELGSGVMPHKEGAVAISRTDLESLQKLASVGYEYLVDYVSDQIVAEKVAEAVRAERAKDAPQKIASAIVAREQNNNRQQFRDKLASAAERDPQLLQALRVLHSRKLL